MKSISRREWFAALARPIKSRIDNFSESAPPSTKVVSKVAVVQGRSCLPYRNSPCFTCSEHCPEDGAITVTQGRPMVNPTICTGCGICHDLCPAPGNAILMIPRK